MKYFIANWKEHKNLSETTFWIKEFNKLLKESDRVLSNLSNNKVKIIICPQHSLIHKAFELLEKFPNLHIGAQNISSYEEGNYTGEVSARSIENIAGFVIVGHSERRRLGETEAETEAKLKLARKYNIEPILCVRGLDDKIYPDTNIVAYEPIGAIGSGQIESLEDILEMKKKLSLPDNTKFLYGGSVDDQNIKEYINNKELDGFIIATAALDPNKFFRITESV